jgi:hypothetical protein
MLHLLNDVFSFIAFPAAKTSGLRRYYFVSVLNCYSFGHCIMPNMMFWELTVLSSSGSVPYN